MRAADELSEFLRANGMKATPQRHAVYEALYRESGHPTADDIYERVQEQMPTISLRTVYQGLHDLVELGEARIVTVGTGAAQFDRNTQRHDHFVCRNCDAIYDVVASRPKLVSGFPGAGETAGNDSAEPTLSSPADAQVSATDPEANLEQPFESAEHFHIETAEVIFRGLCAPCGG